MYKLNDLVSIRGNPSIIWKIKDIQNEFVTLENMSPTGNEDTVKVVEISKIYPATYIPSTLTMPTEYDQIQQQSHYPPSNMDPITGLPVGNHQITPGIQVNPIFVVGDHNSVPSSSPSLPTANQENNGKINISTPSQTIGNGENSIKIKKIEGGESLEEKEENKEEKKEISSNSFFDFLKIRKLG